MILHLGYTRQNFFDLILALTLKSYQNYSTIKSFSNARKKAVFENKTKWNKNNLLFSVN